ncbi:DUF3295 domain-containing protein [Candidatus Bathyarchaeota archaeon]|nr:DUF3295 domain-containing protein [Candidatus Bathyarchaeota archaeon]
MCWRYWNRETIRNDLPEAASAPATMEKPKDIPSTATSVPDLPQLSKSVDSVPDEDALDVTAGCTPLDIRPRIIRQDSCCSRRDRSPRADDFEKLFVSILKEQEPMLPSPAQRLSASIRRSGSTTTEDSALSSEAATSETSQPSPDTQCPSTTVIRGFSPSTATITVEQSPPKASIATPSSLVSQPTSMPQRQTGTFICGASTSSSDQPSLPPKKSIPTKPRQPVFQIGTSGSSEEESSIKENLQKTRSATYLNQRRQPPVSQQLPMATSSDSGDSAIADDSETEGDDFDESAIDDDEDDSDWEDSDEAAGNPPIDDKTYFKRVDSTANLVSRRSLLTLGLEANERQVNERQVRFGNNVASHSTSALHRARALQGVQQPVMGSPNDSDDSPLMMKSRQSPLKPIREAGARTAAQPITAQGTSSHYQAALSPRTTRRHMLATELGESLRRHLLWERQQKSSTANAVLKRRHTSHDVANLKQYPERPCMKKAEDANAGSWNQYFAKEAFNGYHSKGW